MAIGHIPREFIQELLSRVDIIDIIGSRLAIKSAGKEYQALCPFHNEKTPSFTVSATKQFYHCFGCGAHGSALNFIMEYEGLAFTDAVETLANHIGLAVPSVKTNQAPNDREQLLQACHLAKDYFVDQLNQNEKAKKYLDQRAIGVETINKFQLGFALSSWNGLTNYLISKKIQPSLLKKAGLISEKNGKLFDIFRNRVIFPIQDRMGRTIAFGGRSIDEQMPKYLNSPETPLFNKREQLYGLDLAQKAVSKLGETKKIFVVEGYMDVLALEQHGIPNVVATLGTATTKEHVTTIFRYVDEIIFCFDGDQAGKRAAWKAVDAVLPNIKDGKQVSFLLLPQGEDPDSLIRKIGTEKFKEHAKSTTTLSTFIINHFQAQVNLSTMDGRSRFVSLCVPIIEKIPEGIYKNMLLEEVQRVSKSSVINKQLTKKHQEENSLNPNKKLALTPMRTAIALVLQYPQFSQKIVEANINFDQIKKLKTSGSILLAELLDFCQKSTNLNTGSILETQRGQQHYEHLAKLATLNFPGNQIMLQQVFLDCFVKIIAQEKKIVLKKLIENTDISAELNFLNEMQENLKSNSENH